MGIKQALNRKIIQKDKGASVTRSIVAPFVAFLSFICAVAVYGRGVDNHFIADDWIFLYSVSKAHTLADVSKFITFDTSWFVRPTQWITTWVVYQAAMLNPLPYHVVSITIDFANASLLAILTYKLLKTYYRPLGDHAFATIATLVLFLFSWRHHEAVFWYSSVNELIASFFRFSSLLLVLYSIRTRSKTGATIGVGVALGAFALAIFSKESAVVLPVEIMLLFMLDYLTSRNRSKKLALYASFLFPFLLLSALWSVSYLQTSTSNSLVDIERSGLTMLHTSPPNLMFRVLQFFNGNYIGTRLVSKSIPLMTVELSAVLFLSAIAFVRKRYIWLFALLWTVIAIAPYAGMVSKDAVNLQLPVLMLGVAGDRFLYYSAAGASLLLVVSTQWFLDEFQGLTHNNGWLRILKGTIGIAFLVLVLLNVARIITFEAEWDKAGDIGYNIVGRVQELVPDPSPNDVVCVANLPDNYKGKYIFRNGISQALYLAYSRDDFTMKAMIQPPHNLRGQPRFDTTGCSYILYYDESIAEVRKVK